LSSICDKKQHPSSPSNGGRHGRDLQPLITPFDIFNIFLYGQLQAKVALLVTTEGEK
jgi:hypothetical protein